MGKYKLIFGIVLLILISLVTAVTVTQTGYVGNFEQNQWNTTNSTENLTFVGDENQSLFFNLPKHSNVTFGTINITSNGSLENVSVFVGGTNVFVSPFTIYASATETDNSHGVALSGSGAATDWFGVTFTSKIDGLLKNITIDTAVTANRIYIYNHSSPNLLLLNVSKTSNFAEVNFRIFQSQTYRLVVGNVDESSYFRTFKDAGISYPYLGTDVNYNTSWYYNVGTKTWVLDSTAIYNVINLTTDSNAVFRRVLNGTTSFNISNATNNHLGNCINDSYGICNLNITFFSDTPGILTADIGNSINYSLLYNFTYENDTIEKADNDYTLKLFTNKTSSATFNYNNTGQTTTSTYSTGIWTFRSNFRPDWVKDSVLNQTFPIYWNLNVDNNLSNTSLVNQTSFKIYLFNLTGCSTQVLNLTIWNETSNTLLNGSIDPFFDVWFDSETYKRNYSFDFRGTNQYSICTYPSGYNFTTTAQMEYTAPGVETKLYYLFDYLLDTLDEIKLFLTDGTTQVQFNVLDFSSVPVADVFIKVLKYDVGTDTFTTSEIIKSNSDGIAFGQIILNSARYKFILEKDGEVVLETTDVIITSSPKTFRVNIGAGNFDNVNLINGISFNDIIFTNSTKTFSFTFTHTSGSIDQICLKTDRIGINAQSTVNETCVTSTAATIRSTVNEAVGSNTYVATAYAVSGGENYILDTLSRVFDERHKTFGKSGLFIGFLITLTLIMVGLWNPSAAIVMAIFGVVASILLDFLSLQIEFIVAFVVLATIVLYRMKNN